jgi:hypothetical protein
MATAAQLDALDQSLLAAHQTISDAKATQSAVDTATAGVSSAQDALDKANTANTDQLGKMKSALDQVESAKAAAGL